VIRVACLAGLGLLIAFGLNGRVWAEVQGACCRPAVDRATQTLALLLHATPAATPALLGPFDLANAVPVSLVIQNEGDDDRLVRGSSPVATRVVLHQTRLLDGRRVMDPAPDGIIIPAGETVILEPGAGHLMLLGLRATLVQGQTFPLTLDFERAGEVMVTARVRRKVDAAGVEPIPPVAAGDLRISLASAPPAPASTPAA
jgi:copper(I)-binding protein